MKTRQRLTVVETELGQTVVELKLTKEKLSWNTAFLEAQANSSIDAIIVVDTEGRKILQNERVAEIFKIPPDIAERKNDEEQVRWVAGRTKYPAQFVEKVAYLYAHPNEISRDEIELRDGTILDRYSSPVFGSEREYYGRIWTFRDITEQRRVEQDLKEAKVAAVVWEGAQRYNFLADTVPLILWTARPDGGLDYYNKAWFDYTGLTLAQTADWGWGVVLHPDDLLASIARWTRSFSTGEDYEIEYRFKRAADGTYRWFLGRASARRNAAGAIVQWVGTCTDIDDQKRSRSELERRVEERTAELEKMNGALQRQHAELRVLFDLMPAMICFKDTENRILRVNKRVADASGKSVEEIEGKPTLEVYPDGAARYYAEDLEVIHSGAPKMGMVEAMRAPDGAEHWIQTDRVPYRDADGKVIGVVVMAQDITGRKRDEEALRLLSSAVEQSYESIVITDAELHLPGPTILFVNPAFTAMTGYTAQEVLGKTPRILQGPRTDRAVLQRLRENLEKGEPFSGEAINYRKNGTEFILEWHITPIRNDRGKIAHFVAIQRDITGRKQMENALIESNEKFHQLADNITDAFWIRSPDMRKVHYLSPAFQRIWGRSVESLYANPHEWVDFILPEDRERVVQSFAALTGDAPSLDIEYRIVRPGGEIRWVQVRGFQVRDATDQLVRHIGIVTDITGRRLDEERLRESKRFAESIAENSTSIIYIFDLEAHKAVYTNRNAAEALGYSKAQIAEIGDDFLPTRMHPEDLPRILRHHADYANVADGRVFDLEFRLKDASGEWHWMWSRETVFKRRPDGSVWEIMGTAQDITERKRMEAQLFQSQKMETVGKLAGGIAHEFNSILTAIIGQSELLLDDLPPGSLLAKNATEIHKAADLAATLTRQLLAYGRKQFLQPETLDLNQVLAHMDGMFHHLLGGDVETQIIPAPGLWTIRADAGQIEQVIVNMAINARDAMPKGGKLLLETANVSFEEESVGCDTELKPGNYVLLAITDTGLGMTESDKARAFEPFFSTKGVGQGTGLGLSTCYGIIKQSGGHISVSSELGRGTKFDIYLPQLEPETKNPTRLLNSPGLPRGMETILLVENDSALREMATTLLRRLGYTVLAAANGIEALRVIQQRAGGQIDLLFADAVMPHMSGQELADRVRALYVHTRILFTSAYTEHAIVNQGALDKNVALLKKPFTPSGLAHKLREVLDQPRV